MKKDRNISFIIFWNSKFQQQKIIIIFFCICSRIDVNYQALLKRLSLFHKILQRKQLKKKILFFVSLILYMSLTIRNFFKKNDLNMHIWDIKNINELIFASWLSCLDAIRYLRLCTETFRFKHFWNVNVMKTVWLCNFQNGGVLL